MREQVIHLHKEAPTIPRQGAPCNGCGVCCAAQPCPLGMWVSRRLSGACAALSWSQEQKIYRCGVVAAPQHWLPWLPRALSRRLALRWIASAKGCDASFERLS